MKLKLYLQDTETDVLTQLKIDYTFVHIVICLTEYRQGLVPWFDLLHTLTRDCNLHLHTQTSVLSLLQSPLAVAW
jgi:hypothetical protein